MPPNLLPMVSTGSFQTIARAVPVSSATIEPGTRLVTNGQSRMIPSESPPTRAVVGSMEFKCAPSFSMRGRNSLGTVPTFNPRKSRICVEAISTAMPLVNPIVTGRGMKRTAVPNPVAPITISRTPAIAVTISSPEMPNRSTMPGNNHDECARRSADLNARSAQRGDQKSRDHGRIDSSLRSDAARNAKSHRQRQRHYPYRHAGDQILKKNLPGVLPQAKHQLGQPAIERSLG